MIMIMITITIKIKIMIMITITILWQCDLCDAVYVGYTRGHLHNRVKGHKQQSSAIAKLYKKVHGCTGRLFRTCWNVSKCL